MKNVDMPVLANLDTPRRVHIKKRPAAHPQGLFFATQKIYLDGVEKNPRSAPAHYLLLAKLEAYGFGHESLRFLHSYLSNRKQRVRVGSSLS